MTPRLAPIAVLLTAACATTPAPPDGDVHIRYDVTGRVRQAGIVLRQPADDRHDCLMARRLRLPSATAPAPRPDQPTNATLGYAVVFGPDYPPEVAHLNPDWIGYGPQTRFSIEIFPAPDAAGAEGPVRLGRAFRITVAAGDRLWQRDVAEDDNPTDATVTVAPDGRSGRFRVAGLVQQIPHNRMPDTEAIAVAGTWRCP